MVSKSASGNVSETFAKLAEAYETLALIHSRASGKPVPAKKPVVRRDPNEPKKPPSAYTLYIHDKRLEVKSSHPDIVPTEVWKKTMEAWGNISDEERQRYEERVAAMKKEYAAELAKYKAEHGTPAADPGEGEDEDADEEDVSATAPIPAVPAAAPAKASRAKKTKGGDVPAPRPEEDKAEEDVSTVTATAPSKVPRAKKAKGGDAPATKAIVDEEEAPKTPAEPAVAASNGAAPEKRKKKSASAGGAAAATTAENGEEHHDSEKKKKKKKSHKSKHSESQ
ncbi:High mobility group [Coemansia sp. RSA 1694]|nr:High mobility group [Coemansia sp. RSA 1836]KAJ2645125.1 High mobility group [Coemansia sp. RSA 1694]